ncbi:MAG: T9SS type A sorting domain-containing protein [Flavobacteriaceae bacterium]
MKQMLLFLLIVFSIVRIQAQVANQPEDYIICEDPFDGIAIFDLTSKNPEILGIQNPNEFIITYHFSQIDADLNLNPIANPANYVNSSDFEIIYARLEEIATGNFDTTHFILRVGYFPPDLGPFEYLVCSDVGSDHGTFDLTLKDIELIGGDPDLVVTWFATLEDEVNNIPIPNSFAYQNVVSPQVVYGRIVALSTGCKTIVGLVLVNLSNPTPNLSPTPLEYCDEDGNGFGEFDLTLKDAEIIDGYPDVSVLYFETEQEAMEGSNPLPSPYANIVPYFQMVYARVTYDVPPAILPCYTIVELDLVVVDGCLVITIPPTNIYIDEGDANGLAIFDLTVNEAQMIGDYDPTQFLFSYHATFEDSVFGTNAISTPEAYQNIANPQTIFVRLYDSAGTDFGLAQFNIETDGVLGIENAFFSDLKIYPNPVTEMVTISASKLISDTKVELFDVFGKRIFSRNIESTNGTINLNVNFLDDGVYFLTINSEGNLVTKKLIKN